MRILHIITSLRRASGASTYCGGLCNALSRVGYEMTIAVRANRLTEDRFDLDARVRVVSIESVLAGRERYDVVHIHGVWERPIHLALKWARRNGFPVLLSPHGSFASWALRHHAWKKRIAWWLWFRWDLGAVKVLHVTAESEAECLRKLGFRQRLVVSPFGTCLKVIADKGACHHEHVLLTVGRIHPVKGLANLIRAWAKLDVKERGDWRIRMVGPDQDGHRRELERLCVELQVGDSVSLVGPRYGEDLAREFAQCGALALPSFTENFGGVVVDAMLNGKPCIAGTQTPWSELVKERCGWWVDNRPDILKSALSELIALSDSERVAMGERARALARKAFTWDTIALTMANTYRSLHE